MLISQINLLPWFEIARGKKELASVNFRLKTEWGGSKCLKKSQQLPIGELCRSWAFSRFFFYFASYPVKCIFCLAGDSEIRSVRLGKPIFFVCAKMQGSLRPK